jgi:hypothetical protein
MTAHPDQAPTIVRAKRARLPAGSTPPIQPREEVAPNPTSAPKRRYWKPGDIAVATLASKRKTSPLSRKEILAATPPAIRPLTVSVQEARLALGVGNSLVWRLIGAGKLQTVLLGAKRFVTVASMERLIAEQLTKETKP